ncbi:MAG TPA: ferritin-like domain-containing protein [Polyangiaceae bacterium LLY-WYZ-15_(1-7)]|nr:hypothetical protein [Myxococcales bacterium]MAT24566.1 hypothetical protein [Sandaracinus sp.]HJK90919.1 ferritin-like domain-containing protein [Polyangiaceae bacterium LLY-WYZ-15_(1-7)]MBJ71856.1 hypothetical protein [Sandaracinus sp.]HJL03601.1 ferritin-like domain-containing protein [Polyangiaceae bacterium LLY-WYZ-15_(1-7)]
MSEGEADARPARGLLQLEVGDSPLRSEHERLLRTALRRGEKDPEGALAAGRLEGRYEARSLRLAANTWRARVVHEHDSAAVFSRLLPQLMAAGAALEFKTAVLRMSMDELRHASLCAGVVKLLGGDPAVEVDLATQPLPEHPDATPREAALRNAIFVGCLSETVSIALLTEERELTREPVIRRVVDQLAADEVLHAKLGWSYLVATWPTLDEAARARTRAYLPVAFGFLEAKMLDAMPLGPTLPDDLRDELEALGCLDPADARELLYATIEGVIAPRLAEHGLDGKRAWAERRRPGA